MADGKRKPTAYQRALKARSAHCKTGSDATKKRLTSAVSAYKKNAEQKGKKKGDIAKVVSKLTKSCSASSKPKSKSGTTTKRKPATRKRTVKQ